MWRVTETAMALGLITVLMSVYVLKGQAQLSLLESRDEE